MSEWASLNFVEHLLEHTKQRESPTSFWKWAAYGAIGAVLRDNVYRRMGDGRLYPNLYILALAQSGFHRKGAPVEFAEALVREVGSTKIISGRASIQGIMQELSKTETDKKTGKLIKGGSAIFYAQELAASIIQDSAAIGMLTDMYDQKENFDTILKTQARQSISNLVFSLHAASNEELLKSVYDNTALRGGLLARTNLVVPDEVRKPNSLLSEDEEYHNTVLKPSRKCLLEKLKKIASLVGEVSFTLEAQKAYDSWYIPFRNSHQTTRDKAGVLGRIHTTIVKLSMILAANDFTLTINEHHINKAIDECMGLFPNYSKLAAGSSQTNLKETMNLILDSLIKSETKMMSRRNLFQAHLLDFEPTIFDNAVLTLETTGLVQRLINTTGEYYVLTESAKKILES